MLSFFDFLQIIIGVIIIILILLQQRGNEAGGAIFGAATSFFVKRRGLEKNMYILTWILIFLFIVLALLKFYKLL